MRSFTRASRSRRSFRVSKEQLLNRYTNDYVEAWPLETLTVVPIEPEFRGMPSIPEGVSNRNGLWLNVDDELVETSDLVAEDYGNEDMDLARAS